MVEILRGEPQRLLDGAAMGTGGNRRGPLSSHGLSDKAGRWGRMFEGTAAPGRAA